VALAVEFCLARWIVQYHVTPCMSDTSHYFEIADDSMKKMLVMGGLLASLILGCLAVSWGNDIDSNPELEKLQASAVPGIRRAAADAAGYKLTDIVAKNSAHLVTITIVNSKLNNAGTLERKNEASVISTAVAHAIAGKPEFADIMMIHVDYVKRKGNHDDVIEGLDFNKNPAGDFSPHIT
jgi:hypothetical protein